MNCYFRIKIHVRNLLSEKLRSPLKKTTNTKTNRKWLYFLESMLPERKFEIGAPYLVTTLSKNKSWKLSVSLTYFDFCLKKILETVKLQKKRKKKHKSQ